ncbi:MAG: pseudaminic acid cytidylyltransferase, partial [Cytophagales bacterium]|nr:pseudaminic acid cytidylyltransferase [Cytophagales bacterium]
MNRIAIIPARGGSKRIPRKNIKLFCGKPVIAYSIEAAFESGVFDEVMVSTDDEEIAEMAKELGASVPFFRSPETSDDYAVIADVIGEVLSCYRSEGKEFDEFCCLLPAAPFITAARIKEAFDKISAGFESVFPVLKFSYPIKRALQLDGRTGKVSMIWPEHLKTRSQDLPPAYHDSGQFYCMRVEAFLKEKKIFTE